MNKLILFALVLVCVVAYFATEVAAVRFKRQASGDGGGGSPSEVKKKKKNGRAGAGGEGGKKQRGGARAGGGKKNKKKGGKIWILTTILVSYRSPIVGNWVLRQR